MLELKDRNFQTKGVTEHLAKGMEMNPHKGHFHELSEHSGQKAAPKHFRQEKTSSFRTTDQELEQHHICPPWNKVLTVWRENGDCPRVLYPTKLSCE